MLRLSVQPLLFAGYDLARQGRLDEARAKFEEAAGLDKTLDLDALTTKAEKLAAAALVEQGRALAQEGKLDEAVAKFAEAARLDQTLDLEALTAEAKFAVATFYVTEAESLTSSSTVTATSELLQDALALVEELQSPALAMRLCQLDERTQTAVAIDSACDRLAAWTSPIAPGVAVTGVITSTVGDLWRLDITAASHVTVTLSADNSDLDTYLTLYGPQFQLVAAHDDIEQGVIQDSVLNNVALTNLGRYWIAAGRCCPEDDQGTVGAYRLLVTVRRAE